MKADRQPFEPVRGAAEFGSPADDRMAEILRGAARSRRRLRDTLSEEGSAESEDLLGRLNALDFVDSVVGEVSDMPDRLGDYRIIGLLGRGGMGTVYEAFQESLEREVALKVLSPSYSADVTMRQRFRTEARATASLHHEHIVPVYDFGEVGGVMFFAMEKVDGVSLDKHLAAARRHGRGVLEPRRAAERFAGVAEALHHAHRRRILHRDVKPGNLLVGPDGTLALADFGLSKVLGEASMSLTAGGSFLGTLAYAPPEQAKGEPPTPASDLYALGVTMFEAVTGELPLRGNTTEALLDAVLHRAPRRLRDVLPRASRDLDAVVHRLLQKVPADRYADGEELARDLRRIAEGEPVRIRRQWLWVRAWRWARKNRGLAATIALAGILALVSLALGVANWRVRQNSILARHANSLQLAMASSSRQPGPAQGPAGLLFALTGVDEPEVWSLDQTLRHLDVAERLVANDPRAALLRKAYVEDPMPAVTDALRHGFAFRAKQRLDAAIKRAQRGFEARDDVTWLRLYRLYLARAVACMCAAVADADQAKLDLVAASMVRSGAFLPKLLLELVDWSPADDVAELGGHLHDLVRDGPERAAPVAGRLLLVFSGLGRSAASNLMRVAMPYRTRKALFELAGTFLTGPERATPAAERWTGLEQTLAEAAARGVQSFADRPALETALQTGTRLLENEVAPDSPLQSWGLLYRLLWSPQLTGADDARSGSMSVALQVRAWRDFLALGPPRPLLDIFAPRIRRLLEQHPGAPDAPALEADLAAQMGDWPGLLTAADRWYRAEPESPAALLGRFRATVHLGRVEEAAFRGGELLQKVVDPAEVLDEVLAVLRRAEARGGELAARWAELRGEFEAAR